MPLYNFKLRFVPLIKNGSKQHTIRPIRKYPAKPGDTLYLYYGLRQPGASRIITPPVCTDVKTIFIMPDSTVYLVNAILTKEEGAKRLKNETDLLLYAKDSVCLSFTQKDALALHDGFHAGAVQSAFDVMFRFFRADYKLPFCGHIICWSETKLNYLFKEEPNLKILK